MLYLKFVFPDEKSSFYRLTAQRDRKKTNRKKQTRKRKENKYIRKKKGDDEKLYENDRDGTDFLLVILKKLEGY